MAPERTSRPGGPGLPGPRDRDPMANAGRPPGDDAPNQAEVRQRVHDLYNRAETDSGTFNATRAASARERVTPASGREGADPALDGVTRQWFDAARANLGPILPATLPADRRPGGPSGAARSGDPARRPGDEPRALPRGTADPARPELTAGPSRGTPALERGTGPAAALPAVPNGGSGVRDPEPARPASAARRGPSALRDAKKQGRQKLTAARAMLAAHTARQGTLSSAPEFGTSGAPSPAVDRTPGLPGEAERWRQPTALDPDIPVSALSTTAAVTAEAAPGAPGGFPDTGTFGGAGRFDPAVDTGVLGTASGDTGAFARLDTFGTTVAGIDTSVGASAGASGGAFAGAADAGTAPASGYDSKASQALAFARAQIGLPCLWGAAGPGSYDASGLVQAAWRAAGVVLPRSAQDQAATGTAVSLTDLRPGDLIFFHNPVDHVGLYTGDTLMIHAPGPGASIREESILFAGNAAIHSAARPA
ncbi:NlpC/P60 family protein [Streptomyces nodosus]|uniref:C40 family peptidase n=1 Tax=Streptomyces nodosus TaxID=40318 RepID=UPI0034561211